MLFFTLLLVARRLGPLVLWILWTFGPLHVSAQGRRFTINNNCNDTIWPALTQSTVASGTAYYGPTGWEAPAKSSNVVQIPDGWIGSFWARQQCDSNGNCATGQCPGGINCTSTGNTPVTLVEFSLARNLVPQDYYDISIINGFNLPVELKTTNACPTIACATDFDPWCPSYLRAATSSNETTLACDNTEQFYDFYAQGCPNAYVRPTDNDNALFSNQTCPGWNSADYTLTFCPYYTVVATDGSTSSTSTSSDYTSSSSATSWNAQYSQGGATSTTSSAVSGWPTNGGSSTNGSSSQTTNGSHGGALAGIVIAAIAGLAVFAIVLILYLRCRKRQFVIPHETFSDHAVQPFLASPHMFVDMSSVGVDSGAVVGAGVKGGPHVREDNLNTRSNDGRLGKPSKAAPSSPDSESTSSPVSSSSTPNTVDEEDQLIPPTPPGHAPVDIRQLFEDRRFESELLDFLSTRMDPPQAQAANSHRPLRHLGGGDEPPEYREE